MRFALLFWAVLPLYLHAQSNPDSSDRRHMPYSLKIAPTGLINIVQQSLTLQSDIPLGRRWGLDAGAAFVFHSSIFSQYTGETFLGYKLRPIFKYYLRPYVLDRRYVGIVLKFSDIYNRRYYRTTRQGGQYEEWLLLRRRQISGGVSVQFGGIHFWGKNKRWLIEPFLGFGVRWIQNYPGAAPPDAVRVRQRGFFDFTLNEDYYATPDMMFGLHIGHLL